MESFELEVNQKTYKIIRSTSGDITFSVFNYSSFHTISKSNPDYWEVIEHRFGNHLIPLQELGKAIDDHLACCF
ncbi:hypothetical protein [Mucilaginibacter sp. FT3.2]|uniref:hypothetical protein n=1 Tax=Mucilaginibacter sp. FT3.2 TaxID=2723090 RepID=UPI00161C2A8D|nr:hypothetical protein [Mucilaginibacter sp. FT3.2]MBB6233249.1 hypothetical protein [Mucilaginibacter sp. FT3.2]